MKFTTAQKRVLINCYNGVWEGGYAHGVTLKSLIRRGIMRKVSVPIVCPHCGAAGKKKATQYRLTVEGRLAVAKLKGISVEMVGGSS